MTDTRTPEDIRATLQTLADEGGIHTVGRYVELAWSEGLLVTGGNHGDAEGLVLHAGQDDDCLTDDPAEVAEIDSDEISQPQGVHPDGPYYRPVLVVQAPRDPATVYAVIWAEMDGADAAADEIATLRAEIARLTAIKDKAAETMRVWHKELTTLREEAANLRAQVFDLSAQVAQLQPESDDDSACNGCRCATCAKSNNLADCRHCWDCKEDSPMGSCLEYVERTNQPL